MVSEHLVVVESWMRFHVTVWLYSGQFNGDPHPGNILLLSDGRLGLIDYGQVKNISAQDRIKYAKLIIAHTRGDRKVCYSICALLNFLSPVIHWGDRKLFVSTSTNWEL